MTEPFSVRFTVRSYEIDTLGHLNGAFYVSYADHTRYECSRAAGVDPDVLREAGLGPVNLETTIRYLAELRYGDEVEVTCAFLWGEGKSFRARQEFRRVDGTVAAEVTSVCGLLDLQARKLVPEPRERWRSLATAPEVLGL
ncbi:MAG: acyl-CoA thioesterase [Acidimicrobiia bacterium]